MLEALAKTIRKFRLQLPIALITVLLSPLAVTAEPNDQSCETAQRQIDQTQHTLLPLKKQQQQIQQHVRTIYQELFVCKAGSALSLEQEKHCTHLQEEGAQKFQAMINVITLAHQASQQLASQTRQVQLSCSAIAAEDRFPKQPACPSSKKYCTEPLTEMFNDRMFSQSLSTETSSIRRKTKMDSR